LSKNIYWDQVESVTLIGEVPVFDRQVPKTNNFVVNGIIVHNSGSLEQDADSVIFIYRDEYYGNTEDENGNATQGVAEIIIAKHRNGALGVPKLSYTDNVARFSDLGTHKTSIEYHPDSLIEPNKSFLEKPF